MIKVLLKRLLKLLSILIACFLFFKTHSAPVTYKKNIQKVSVEELGAAVLLGEASIDGIEGMKAVSEVIRNRMRAKVWTMYQVLNDKYAFSCLNNYRGRYQEFINKYKKYSNFNIALDIIKNYRGNKTRGALYYHEKRVRPHWSKNKVPIAVIGHHKFFAFVF